MARLKNGTFLLSQLSYSPLLELATAQVYLSVTAEHLEDTIGLLD